MYDIIFIQMIGCTLVFTLRLCAEGLKFLSNIICHFLTFCGCAWLEDKMHLRSNNKKEGLVPPI